MRRGPGLALALVAACISGVAVFVNSDGVKAVGDATVYTTAKNLVAAALLVVLASTVGRARGPGAVAEIRGLTPRRRLGLLALAVVGGSVPFVLFFEGLLRASSVHAAFLHKTLLVWVALLAVPLLRERLTGWHWAAVGLLVTGQAVLAGGVTESFGTGEALVLAATLFWAVEVVLAKRLLGSVSSWTVGVARMAGGAVLLVGWLAVRGRLGALLRLDAEAWGWVLVTGAILSAYVATWLAALARAQAVDVTAVLVVAALVTAALAAAVDGVRPAPLGAGLVLAGALTAVAAARTGRPAVAARGGPHRTPSGAP